MPHQAVCRLLCGRMGGAAKSSSAKRIQVLGRMSSTRPLASQNLISHKLYVQKELAELSQDPPANCSAGPKADNIYEWVSVLAIETASLAWRNAWKHSKRQ